MVFQVILLASNFLVNQNMFETNFQLSINLNINFVTIKLMFEFCIETHITVGERSKKQRVSIERAFIETYLEKFTKKTICCPIVFLVKCGFFRSHKFPHFSATNKLLLYAVRQVHGLRYSVCLCPGQQEYLSLTECVCG